MGRRLTQIKKDTDGAGPEVAEDSYYGYNPHTDVETLTKDNGDTRATYGYTAYGSNDEQAFTGIDKPDAQQPGKEPFNFYRYNGKRYDPASGGYDMGFRDYQPNINRFTVRDTFNGAFKDMALGVDPWNGNRYAFTGGNPISRIELDGHCGLWDWLCDTGDALGDAAEAVGEAASDVGDFLADSADDIGQMALGTAAAVGGAALFVAGGTLAVGGTAACGTGVLCPAGAPAAALGATAAATGGGIFIVGIGMFGDGLYNLFNSDSGGGTGFSGGHSTPDKELKYTSSQGSGQDLKRSATFGDDQWQFNTGHGFDRVRTGPGGVQNDLRTTGLTPDEIEKSIAADAYSHMANGGIMPRTGTQGFSGPLERRVQVGGFDIGYRMVQTPDNVYRVSTYWLNS
ncbi:RHS repeat-associated core domain-containing protein [Actinokineospora fastidiosa]|uniref:RHS repeat-associated core domain-containing protein n=1 Tax=Actinokineospora fastidiosa TaxID=1816 RepID=A0A918GQH2_9PSEU|nr:RHS repeat-associated core domain-containing protein [Actinokineospora fastidiosa]GGS54631.1 hypothetical protein GCM10010171_57230 [Actinokineospora fastidiosa]